MSNERKPRNNAFDLLCGICILRMVTLHAVCQTGLRGAVWWRETMAWTFFFMCFFFFKAGYFNKGVGGNAFAYLRDRFLRLLVPYFAWGIIGGLIAFCWLCLFPEGIHKALAGIAKFRWATNGFTFGNSPLWFLLSFFSAYIIVFFMERIRHLHWAVLLFPAISYWLFRLGNPLWFGLNNVFCGTACFYLGKVWHRALNHLGRRRALVVSVVLCAGFVVANIFAHGSYEMHDNAWKGAFWQVILCTLLSLPGISGILLSLPTPRVPLVSYIGEHSMVYFVMHYPIILSYAYACILLGHDRKGSIPDLILSTLLSFALCTLAVPYVKRIPWLSGRTNVCPPQPPVHRPVTAYFYHTQDTERIVREWQQGVFPAHFLYGALGLCDHGIDVIWHHQIHTYRRLRDMLIATWKILSCRKPYDVLYATHTLGIEPIILLRALRLYRHPIVVWHHQPIVKAKNPLREAVARIFYHGMDHMIFFSDKLVSDSLHSKKADLGRMSVVPWGADLRYYDSLRPDEQSACLFISSGKELRDYETLLAAFHATKLPLTLYVERKRLPYFKTLHAASNITLHYGDRPIPHEIALLVAQCRCVCICCQESNYTVGLTTVVEALALGKAILCTRNMQMPMDIEAEGCGFWLEPHDVEGWVEKLHYIADHPIEAEAMGRKGRALAERLYNAEECSRCVAETIKATLNRTTANTGNG